jgi:hypothetical protein
MTRIRLLVIGGLAWSGVVLGHLVAYVVTFPAEAERAAYLASTGHGSFPILLVSAVAAIPAVLSLVAVRVIRGERSPSFLSTTVWLTGFQVLAFLAMEFFERGMAFEHALLEPALLVGLVIQVLVAATSALLIKTVFSALKALVAQVCDVPRLAPVRSLPPPTDPPLTRFEFLISTPRRAPPLLFAL